MTKNASTSTRIHTILLELRRWYSSLRCAASDVWCRNRRRAYREQKFCLEQKFKKYKYELHTFLAQRPLWLRSCGYLQIMGYLSVVLLPRMTDDNDGCCMVVCYDGSRLGPSIEGPHGMRKLGCLLYMLSVVWRSQELGWTGLLSFIQQVNKTSS